MPLLEVRNLVTQFELEAGVIRAVDGVSFHLEPGETLGLVGESGCGKSVTSLSLMRLLQTPPARIAGGEILFEGRDLLKLSERQMQEVRGNEISMIFQEPMTSLNPVHTVGRQIAEVLELHQNLTGRAAWKKAVEMLELVGIPSPEQRARQFPHQLSGGMRQRVMIAMAVACRPKLLIADEPTTALDVTIQAQILDLMKELRDELGTAILLITHDLGVVADMCDRVAVMYAGRIVEKSDVYSLFSRPRHPYSEGLLHSIPRLEGGRERLHVIQGVVPDPLHMPPGCAFHPRCPYAVEACRQEAPALVEAGDGRPGTGMPGLSTSRGGADEKPDEGTGRSPVGRVACLRAHELHLEGVMEGEVAS